MADGELNAGNVVVPWSTLPAEWRLGTRDRARRPPVFLAKSQTSARCRHDTVPWLHSYSGSIPAASTNSSRRRRGATVVSAVVATAPGPQESSPSSSAARADARRATTRRAASAFPDGGVRVRLRLGGLRGAAVVFALMRQRRLVLSAGP